MRKLVLGIAICITYFSGIAYAEEQTSTHTKKTADSVPYVLPWTYEIDFRSDIQQQDYKLVVRFPPGYNESEEGFPVIYILDGQYHYPLVSAAHGNYAWDGTIPNAITVGISWAGENLNVEALRLLNFTPSQSKKQKLSGGADAFIKVLKEEIIPFVEGHYKTNSSRTITGSSLSGLFSLYVMTKEPALFNNIVALSPSMWWENREIDNLLKAHFDKTDLPPVKIYAARGEYELYGMGENDKMFRELMSDLNGNIGIRYDIVEGAGHSGVNPQGFARGLRYVFGRNELPISEIEKQRMAGIYISDNKMVPKVELQSDANGLYFDDGQSNKIYVHSHSDSEFYINEFNADVAFLELKDKKYQKVKVSPLNQGDIVYTRQ